MSRKTWKHGGRLGDVTDRFVIMTALRGRYRLGVRTEDSQSSNTGSIPVSATIRASIVLDFDTSIMVQINWKLGFVSSRLCRVSKKGRRGPCFGTPEAKPAIKTIPGSGCHRRPQTVRCVQGLPPGFCARAAACGSRPRAPELTNGGSRSRPSGYPSIRSCGN